MKKFAATLLIAGSALTLAACDTTQSTTYDSGASYANDRTAGSVDGAPVQAEQTFSSGQAK